MKPPRSARLRLVLVFVLATAFWTANGGAARAEPGLRLTLEAPEGCAEPAELEAGIAARGVRVDDLPGDRELRVRIEADGDAFEGQLSITRVDAVEPASRRVRGASCAEVVDALAAVAAIVLSEPVQDSADEIANAAAPAVAAPEARTEPTQRPDSAPRPARAATAASPRRDARTLHATGYLLGPNEGERDLEVSAGTLQVDRGWDLTLMGGAVLGILPGQAVPRFDLVSVQGTLLSMPEDGPTFLVAPLLLGRVSWLGPATLATDRADVQLFGLGAGIGTCFAPVYHRAALTLLLCGELGFGAATLETRERASEDRQSATRAYGSVGFSSMMQYALTRAIHIGLRAGIDVTTQPFSAQAADGRTVFHSTRILASDGFEGYGLSGYLQLSVGFHF